MRERDNQSGKQMKVLAIDTETTGLGYFDMPFCISYAWRDEDGDLKSNVSYPPFHLETWGRDLVFHNAKFDLQKLYLAGVLSSWDWSNIHDTECMSHLINEQQPKSLKRLAKDILGLETNEEAALRAARTKLKIKKSEGYAALPRDILEPYAKRDAELTLLLFEFFWPTISGDEDLYRLYQEEQELTGVLYDMEMRGIGVDVEYLDSVSKSLAKEILESEIHIRELAGAEDFNPSSWRQVKDVLEKRGHKIASTSKAVLEDLDDDFASELLHYRKQSKLFSTYIRALKEETQDAVFHPNFKQWGTRGRRLSSGENKDD